ncbi:MAG: hypothetical protein Pg6C_01510 [Treponemataceae bacterium]|nr:MAG: hypothetical protein Pg6C_01510 [Treponemataceae bacterium]
MDKTRRQPLLNRKLPSIITEKCTGCGSCAKVCFRRAISFTENKKADISAKRCIGIESCDRCVKTCSHNAITISP